MATVSTSDTGKSVVEDATIKLAVIDEPLTFPCSYLLNDQKKASNEKSDE